MLKAQALCISKECCKGQLELQSRKAKQKGGKDTFSIFYATPSFAFPIFANEVSSFDRTCLIGCFMPMKKMPKILQVSYS